MLQCNTEPRSCTGHCKACEGSMVHIRHHRPFIQSLQGPLGNSQNRLRRPHSHPPCARHHSKTCLSLLAGVTQQCVAVIDLPASDSGSDPALYSLMNSIIILAPAALLQSSHYSVLTLSSGDRVSQTQVQVVLWRELCTCVHHHQVGD